VGIVGKSDVTEEIKIRKACSVRLMEMEIGLMGEG
jgi:hypothetical protein